MFGAKFLIDKLNTLIASGSLTDLQLAQASGAVDMLIKKGVGAVATAADLPDPVTNRGRFYYITSESRYVLSNGVRWDINNIIKAANVNLYSWGSSRFGSLADNGLTAQYGSRVSPASISGSFSDWVDVASGYEHSVALRANGTAWSWGRNNWGQLGDGTSVNKSSPVAVVGGFTDWVQVSCTQHRSHGIRANGTLWGWGINGQGRLGDGTTTERSSPVSVVGGFTDWVNVSSCGYITTHAVRANGTLWGWGYNVQGQVGDGTATLRTSPVSVVGGFTDWIQVFNGFNHTLGLRGNGSLWAWGGNGSGQLGDGTTVSKSSPVSVVGGFTDWASLPTKGAGSSFTSAAIRANGTLWTWGAAYSGMLGDNTSVSKSSPVSVVGGFTDWVQVTLCRENMLGLRANGTAWGWGAGSSYQLGSGSLTNRSSPVSVIGGFSDWVAVSSARFGGIGIRG